jgi:hypothetical protein
MFLTLFNTPNHSLFFLWCFENFPGLKKIASWICLSTQKGGLWFKAVSQRVVVIIRGQLNEIDIKRNTLNGHFKLTNTALIEKYAKMYVGAQSYLAKR